MGSGSSCFDDQCPNALSELTAEEIVKYIQSLKHFVCDDDLAKLIIDHDLNGLKFFSLSFSNASQFGLNEKDQCYSLIDLRNKVLSSPIEIPDSQVMKVCLKTFPEALETAVYVHEKNPFVLDVSGQAARFLKYQKGSFLMYTNMLDMDKNKLRRSLIGCLQHGSPLTICFDKLLSVDFSLIFDELFFPIAVLSRQEIFKESVWTKLLRPDEGDPDPLQFLPRDEFKLILLISQCEMIPSVSQLMYAVEVTDDSLEDESNKDSHKNLAEALGLNEVRRNSINMVEAGFDGELDEIKLFLDKGYHLESEDGHMHTTLSEAASQGHNHVIQFLVEQGANPNALNDDKRSPLYRAAYNGHMDTISLLLKCGGDPRIVTNQGETAFDIAKTKDAQDLLANWDITETVKLLEERSKMIARKLEERLQTHVDREEFAKMKIREDLISIVIDGDCEKLKNALDDLALESMKTNTKPRGTAQTRDSKGNTLLSLAAQYNHADIAEFLLTYWKTFDETEENKISINVFKTNPNTKDMKGWTPTAIATFHHSKQVLFLLLDNGGDPTIKNQYNKNAFCLAQDELDAAGNVIKYHTEMREILEQWDAGQIRSTLNRSKIVAVSDPEELPINGTSMQMNIEMAKEGVESSRIKPVKLNPKQIKKKKKKKV